MSKLITQLGYLGLEVSDLPQWEKFAAGVLGLGVSVGPRPDTRWLRMDEHRHRFILTEGPADDVSFAGWQVSNSAAVDAFGEHLDALGIARTWASDNELALRAVQRMLHFKDPAGNRHEVYCGAALASTRFISPSVASTFVAGHEGLGHIVYSSSEYAKTIDFAQSVLGFSVSDQIRLAVRPGFTFEVTFMHANSRHHSFALAPQPPIPGPHKRVHHFMVEVASVEEVGFARDRCLAMGQAVHMDIGQHPNDKMISFYGQTPSGFFVEFGYGGVKVDEATWQTVTYDKLSEWGHRANPDVPQKPAFAPKASEARPVSVAGTWKVVIKTPMGNDEVSFDLQLEGGSVHGAVIGAQETSPIRDGAVDGGKLSWRATVNHPMTMDLEFSATVEGDAISGGAKSPFGTAPFSGTRA